MEQIEYTKMANLYDTFYANKNYNADVEFIKNFIKTTNCDILDAGCGTGNHAVILNKQGFNVRGFDKSQEMINIANKKLENSFFVDDLLSIKNQSRFDVIISFFAVFNHLKNYNEFTIALRNLKELLNSHGTIIIDLHNPQKSGKKIETINNTTRIMEWKKCALLQKEYSTLTYLIDNKTYTTKHIFKIYNIKKIYKIAQNLGFQTIQFYENYNINKFATAKSKNIQVVLTV